MIWRNPLAWLGIAAVAIPILVHLIGRRTPRRLPFPTLRFVTLAPTLPSRRHRLTDLPLLAVRIALIAAAVAALAQPWWPRTVAQTNGGIARALVVDSSVSMTRFVAPGRTALDEGRALAAAAAAGASVTRVVEAGALHTALPAALGWLATQSGTHEIIAFSDFQRGALDDADVAAV
ncbi:MAG TPA: BatA domain-containing protein, partial [Vicinamibacterales bacterium]|nr:BatA domain-containing protein [Vicinamibacterales bacterium]